MTLGFKKKLKREDQLLDLKMPKSRVSELLLLKHSNLGRGTTTIGEHSEEELNPHDHPLKTFGLCAKRVAKMKIAPCQPEVVLDYLQHPNDDRRDVAATWRVEAKK